MPKAAAKKPAAPVAEDQEPAPADSLLEPLPPTTVEARLPAAERPDLAHGVDAPNDCANGLDEPCGPANYEPAPWDLVPCFEHFMAEGLQNLVRREGYGAMGRDAIRDNVQQIGDLRVNLLLAVGAPPDVVLEAHERVDEAIRNISTMAKVSTYAIDKAIEDAVSDVVADRRRQRARLRQMWGLEAPPAPAKQAKPAPADSGVVAPPPPAIDDSQVRLKAMLGAPEGDED